MAAISPPGWMQAGSYPARVDRLTAITGMAGYSGFAADESTPLRIRQGVRPSYQNYQLKARPTATASMSVIVSAGICIIENHDLAGYGAYICVNDADVTLTIAAADATKYRRDTIVAAVYDAETAGSSSNWSLQVVQGPLVSTAGAMTRGTLPPNAQIIADVNVNPGVTSIGSSAISDVRNYAVAAGGIVPILSTLDMDHPHPGQVRYRTDTDTFVYGKSDGTTATLKSPPNWVNITLASGYSISGATPQVWKDEHGIVHARGQFQYSSNLTHDSAGHQWGTLPDSSYYPDIYRALPAAGGSGVMARIDVSTGGALSYAINSVNTSNTTWMSIDGLWWQAAS